MTYVLSKVYGFGSVLSCDPTGGTSFAALGAIVDGWEESEAKAEEINTAVLSDKYQTFAAGQADPGSCSYMVAYDPTTTSVASTLGSLLTAGTVANWQTTLNTSAGAVHTTFQGPVVGLSVAVKKANLVTQNVTIKKSGNPGFIGT